MVVLVAAAAEAEAVGEEEAGAPAAAPPPARRGAPAACPYCHTKVCLDCGAFWALGAPSGAGSLFPVAGVNIGSHSARTCGEFREHVAALPRDCVGLVGTDASGMAEAAGRVVSLFAKPRGGGGGGGGGTEGGGSNESDSGTGPVPELNKAEGV